MVVLGYISLQGFACSEFSFLNSVELNELNPVGPLACVEVGVLRDGMFILDSVLPLSSMSPSQSKQLSRKLTFFDEEAHVHGWCIVDRLTMLGLCCANQ